ncbi:hypothetical protein BU15DRAFT_40532 [Melanogaster broomeanus]|nr:hypothetical protein BU15DRAFT_40532 [Melanogaster broomeanus]
MTPLERTVSSSSTASTTSLSYPNAPEHLAGSSVSYVPYVRRRNTPVQLEALQQSFEITPHPTREQRQALANQLGMELKSVTNWFQNRRQTTRRKSLSWNENKFTKTRHSLRRHGPKDSLKPGRNRSAVSLDCIAALSERTPLTPRKSNVKEETTHSPPELWKHMLSSPTVPQSSPGLEEARMAILPSRAKTFRSLEWACLKARREKWVDDVADELPTLPALERSGDTDDAGTETEDEEVITPESSVNLSPQSDASSRLRMEGHDIFTVSKTAPQSQDVEAALTLLGFKACS